MTVVGFTLNEDGLGLADDRPTIGPAARCDRCGAYNGLGLRSGRIVCVITDGAAICPPRRLP